MSTESEIATWMDKLAIQELAVRCCDAVSRGDWDAYEAMWTPDGVWEETAPVEAREAGGAKAIRARVAASLEQVEFFAQMCHGVTIAELTRASARARTAIHGIARTEGASYVNYGIYYDELVKTDGLWRYRRRRLENIYVDWTTLPGMVPIPRAGLR
jgi:ketosteroid isomerase-like protein